MVGSAPKSNGGVTSAIKILRQSTIWNKYQCYWLGTQIQAGFLLKLYYCIKAYFIAFFIIWRYDIIHFHTVPDISLIVQLPVYLLALIGNKKIILHMHVGNQLETYKDSRLFHFCIKHADLILVLSPKWKIKFEELFEKFHKRVEVLYNSYTPVNAIDYDKRKKTIIFAGHLDKKYKAYDILLKGFASIAKQIPDWKLIVMGTGELHEAISLAKKLGIDNQTEFKGYIVGKEKEKHFQEASLFCLCSYQEGFPMVVIEAWAYGIPVITTPVGGLPDVLEETKNAVTFYFGDYKSLGENILMLINKKEMRTKMSLYSQESVARNFSLNSVSSVLDSYYTSLK